MTSAAHSDPNLTAFLARHARHTDGQSPVAVFDCDGTMIRGDIGEAMFHRQIERFWFRVSPASVWPDHPRRSDIEDLYQALRAMPEASRPRSGECRGHFCGATPHQQDR